MKTADATLAFSALSQKTRLEVFRLLVSRGEAGMAAGEIGEALDVRQNTMSVNLNVLLQAGLVRNEREGRSIRYYANLETMRDLVAFLVADCCGGRPERCRVLLDEITC